ncbi:MAG: hypothetical protein JO235_28100 [Chroococcidiopsidaceae cyanobacterium CP_BM_RX_35]|nr:hypothetical protein [Chroococcidiopsidaceae cyanobacterium CP_BM_RX_35]
MIRPQLTYFFYHILTYARTLLIIQQRPKMSERTEVTVPSVYRLILSINEVSLYQDLCH